MRSLFPASIVDEVGTYTQIKGEIYDRENVCLLFFDRKETQQRKTWKKLELELELEPVLLSSYDKVSAIEHNSVR